jgi:hypothetical protein
MGARSLQPVLCGYFKLITFVYSEYGFLQDSLEPDYAGLSFFVGYLVDPAAMTKRVAKRRQLSEFDCQSFPVEARPEELIHEDRFKLAQVAEFQPCREGSILPLIERRVASSFFSNSVFRFLIDVTGKPPHIVAERRCNEAAQLQFYGFNALVEHLNCQSALEWVP